MQTDLPAAMSNPLIHPVVRRAGVVVLATLATTFTAQGPAAAQAGALFSAGEVEPQRFVLVAAPIGNGERAQLNIYEQVKDRRACFAIGEGRPAVVNPLLGSFDFTGICSRYIDANGYSVRIGGTDFGSSYRLMVSRGSNDNLLLALPTKPGVGPEMVVARTQGLGSGFLKLELEPGWRLMRRQYGTRKLGHLYVYRQDWPTATAGSTPAVPGQDLAPMPGMKPPQQLLPPQQLPVPNQKLPVPAVAAPAVTAPAPKVPPSQKPVQGQPLQPKPAAEPPLQPKAVPGLAPVPPLTPPAQSPATKKP